MWGGRGRRCSESDPGRESDAVVKVHRIARLVLRSHYETTGFCSVLSYYLPDLVEISEDVFGQGFSFLAPAIACLNYKRFVC